MPDKTPSSIHEFITHQALTHPGSIEGTEYNCEGNLEGTITIKVANVETTANATAYEVMVFGNLESSGNDDKWALLYSSPGPIVAAESEALTATEDAGDTSLAVASTANIEVGKQIYVQDVGVVADGEWHFTKRIVSNTSVDIFFGLENAKDSSDTIWTQARVFKIEFEIGGWKRLNVVVLHEAATGSDLHIHAEGIFITKFE